MKILLSRLVKTLLILAALYLIPVNLALNLPAVKDYLNGIEPDRFAVTWERALSLYPLRVELIGLAADGQTAAEQWQLDARRAAASVSLLPLLAGEIRVHDLDLADVDLRLRPRPTPEEGRGDFADFFPVIRNRDPESPAEPATDAAGGALVLEIDDIHVTGDHAFWVSHIRGSLPGEVRGSFRVDTEAGQIALSGGALDLALASLQIADQTHVTDAAAIRGRIDIPPFLLAEAKGLAALTLPEIDAEIDVPVRDLRFLALLMGDLGGLELGGQGRLRGRLVYERGEALRGTDLVVEAHELRLGLSRYRFDGDGMIELRVDPEDSDQGDLVVRFDAVQASLLPEPLADGGAPAKPRPLFSGDDLEVVLHAEEQPRTDGEDGTETDVRLTLTIPSVQVPDLAAHNRLLPDKWGLALLGGAGTLKARMVITSQVLSLDLDLASDEADVRFADYHATTDLRLQLRARVDQAAGATLHLNGTSLQIEDAEVATGAAQPHAKPWRADLRIAEGALTLPVPADAPGVDPIPAVAKALMDEGFGALLAAADGRLSASLTVSRLDWIAELLDRPLGLRLAGAGEVDAAVVLADGWPDRGTRLLVKAPELAATLGRYRFSGDGTVAVRIDPADVDRAGGEDAGDLVIRFDAVQGQLLPGPVAAGASEAQPLPLFSGDDLELALHAEERAWTESANQDAAGAEGSQRLRLSLPSVQVPDLRVYNRLLPDKWGLALVGGTGTLSARVVMTPTSLAAELDLGSDEAELRYRDVHATTDLALALRARIDESDRSTLRLAGTTLRLEDAEVEALAGQNPEPPAQSQTESPDEPRGERPHSDPWQAQLAIHEGVLTLPTAPRGGAGGPASPAAVVAAPKAARLLAEEGFGALLAGADGDLTATLTVSGLDWIAEVLGRPLDLALIGSGALAADIVLADGLPARGTTLAVPREALALALLEHRIDGRGEATLRVEKGGKQPRLHLGVALDEARMRRRDEPEPSVGDVRMDAEVVVTDPLGAATEDVRLQIHSAAIHDMSTYNAYLPPHLPLAFLSGTASLVGDLHFGPDTAAGELLLRAEAIRAAWQETELSGDLRVGLLIRGGSAEDMRFDITGSSLALDGFRVVGDAGSAQSPDWYARLQLEETEVLWHKPMHLDMTAGITIKDTRPIVALVDNLRGQHSWIEDLLTVDDIGGHLVLTLDGDRVVLSDALVGGDALTVGVKGRADADDREAMVYLRWHDLTAAAELAGKETHFHLTDARGRFDAYAPDRRGTGTSAAQASEARATLAVQHLEAATQEPAPAAAAGGGQPALAPAVHEAASTPAPQDDEASAEPENLFMDP